METSRGNTVSQQVIIPPFQKIQKILSTWSSLAKNYPNFPNFVDPKLILHNLSHASRELETELSPVRDESIDFFSLSIDKISFLIGALMNRFERK